MSTVSNDQLCPLSKQVVTFAFFAVSLLVVPLLFNDCAFGADTREVLHQKILAGDQVSLNPSDPEDARTIDPQWLKEAGLRHVRVDIHHAVIEGALDAEDVTFDQRFTMTGCVFTGYANFTHAVFKRGFEVSEAVFRAGASFQGATFERTASFQRSRFERGPVIFDDAHFLEIFDASEAKFVANDRAMATFIGVRFDSKAIFAGSLFAVGVDFISAQFSGETIFVKATFLASAEFEQSHFIGPASFGASALNKPFSASFLGGTFFSNTQFDSTATFDGVTFSGGVTFFNARFGSVAQFLGTTFNSISDFSMVRFGNDAWFMGAVFLGKANFTSAYIAGSLFFQAEKPLPAAIFRGEAQFAMVQVENFVGFGGGADTSRGVVFASKATFRGAKFSGVTSFQGVEFKKDVEFLDATMGNDAYFLGAKFEGAALFDRVHIAGAALFSPKPGVATSSFAQSAHFVRSASFVGAHFDSGARFSGVKFDAQADFVGAHFEGDAHFEDSQFLGPSNFRSATFRAVYLTTADTGGPPQFMNDVDLLGCTYERIQVDWRSLLRYPNGQSRIRPYDRQPYIELEAALRRAGSADDADAVYAERRRVENQNLTGSRKALDRIYFLLANYGIDGWHEFFIALFFLGLGMWVFSRPGAVVQNCDREETKISPYQALPLAIHQFLPFGLPVKPPWTPTRRTVLKFLRTSAYANFLQILGWILIPLVAAWLAVFLRHGN